MNTTTVQYPGYTIEIADFLTHHFRVLATILSGVEFDHPIDLLGAEVTSELIVKCNECVSASIGKEFAHEATIADALAKWTTLSWFERVTIIVNAASNTEPLEISSVFTASADIELD